MVDVMLNRCAKDARSLMTANPVSINEHATLQEAAAFLTTRGISAAPVIDDAGKAVGVLSRTDIVRYTSGEFGERNVMPEYYDDVNPLANDEACRCAREAEVWQVMSPVVLSVRSDASLSQVIEELLVRKVHRLFVIDYDGTLIGVISAIDVLRGLTQLRNTVRGWASRW